MVDELCPTPPAVAGCAVPSAPGMEVFASISCASVTTRWLEAVASLADPNARQTVLINVGANKGYMLAMWMALFAAERV